MCSDDATSRHRRSKDPFRGGIRCALHDQIDQLPEGPDARRSVDAPEDLAAADIQGRHAEGEASVPLRTYSNS
jgi:hypothetical protein